MRGWWNTYDLIGVNCASGVKFCDAIENYIMTEIHVPDANISIRVKKKDERFRLVLEDLEQFITRRS